MKKKILLFASYLLVAVLATVVTLAAVGYPGRAEVSKLDQLEALILERFIGEKDQTAMEDAAADAMVKALGDRWSYYIPASEYEAHQEQVNNAYVGIGVTIQVTQEQEGFLIQVVNEGGPAEEAGVQVGDLLIQVDDQDVRGLTAAEVRNLVRGEEGTYVSLTVLRQDEAVTLPVERRQVETVVASGRMLTETVGLVTIENFDSRCAEETIAAIDSLLADGAEKLIFDVRNNPGGYAKELVKVLDYLLPEGELFRTVSYSGQEHVDYSDESCLDIPMAVLVNEESYSAAEFFAAALSEYGAATVVGEQTCGKGYFQNTLRLSDGSAVGLSVGKYFTPNGVSLAGVGVTPDVLAAVDEETVNAIRYGKLEPEEDPQLQAALDILEKG
ncbi:MAG: S41 family peptidase [Faecousia sp.]